MAENSVAASKPGQLPTVGEKCLRVWRTLKSWQPAHHLPRGITPDGLEQAWEDARQSLIPADYKAFGVIMDRLFSFAETFSVKDAGIRDAMRFYRETLDDMPADLLEKAVDQTVRTYKYGHRLPPPGDLRAVVEDDLSLRVQAKARIEAALSSGRYAEELTQPRSQADKDRVARIVAEAKRGLMAERG